MDGPTAARNPSGRPPAPTSARTAARAADWAAPPQTAAPRADHLRAVDLLEEGRGLRAEPVLLQQWLGLGAERRKWLPEGGHPREIARREEMGHARAFEQRRDEVRRRIALEARSGHGIRHCLTRHDAFPERLLGRLDLRGAVGAARRLERDLRQAERARARGGRRRGGRKEPVDLLDRRKT